MKKTKQKGVWLQVGLIIVFIIGVIIALYPFYVGALNNFIDRYRVGQIARENTQQNATRLAKLEAKNKQATEKAKNDPFKNTSNKTKVDLKKHLIGKVIIPKIAVDIPLFDTTNSQTIQYGAAVLDGTAYPVGGKGTHSVVSSHRGLPERKLFTDLNKLKKGDIFIFEVYNKKLAYQIEEIKTVLPSDTSILQAEPGRDLASLLTCTPYMLNTHRLVLKGHRIPYTAKMDEQSKDAVWRNFIKNMLILLACALIFGWLLYLLVTTIYGALLKKQKFDLEFYCVAADGRPLSGKKFGLYDKRSKKLLQRNGRPYLVKSDAKGKVRFAHLPGGLYSILLEDATRKERMVVGIKKRSEQQGKFYPKKWQRPKVIHLDNGYNWIF